MSQLVVAYSAQVVPQGQWWKVTPDKVSWLPVEVVLVKFDRSRSDARIRDAKRIILFKIVAERNLSGGA